MWGKSYLKQFYVEQQQNVKKIKIKIQTYPDRIRFLRGLLNKPRSSILFTNKCKNNLLVNGLRFVLLTQKEPVHKSHLLMKPNTLGALRARATIVQGNTLKKKTIMCHYFPLRCHCHG